MNLILKAGDKVVRVIKADDDLGIPEKMIYALACETCVKTHRVTFVHVGMHDDGEIFECRKFH